MGTPIEEELETFNDLIELLVECKEAIQQPNHNIIIETMNFFNIESRVRQKIAFLSDKAKTMKKENRLRFLELRGTALGLILYIRKNWNRKHKKEYEKLASDRENIPLSSPTNILEKVDTLNKLALDLSKDIRIGGKMQKVQISSQKREKKNLIEVQEEQKEYEDCKITFSTPEDGCCLLL